MINIKEYRQVQSLEEAYELNQKRNNRIIAGMLWTKMSSGNVNVAIDLSALGLDTIEETDEAFRIGCMVSLRQLECHQGLGEYTQGAVRDALHHIVGVQFRNVATVGGSIYGRYGFSDVLTLLLGMDSYVELYQGGIISLKDYAKKEYDNDILVRVIVKKCPLQMGYQSVRNTKTDFPTIACAISKMGESYQAVIGARPGRAVVITDEEGILKNGVTEESARSYGAYVAEHIQTGSNMRGSKEYRSHLIKVLVERTLLAMEGGKEESYAD